MSGANSSYFKDDDEPFDPNYVPQRTRASDPNHVPLLTTAEKRALADFANLENLPETASSRRHQVEGANGGRRRGRRISRRRTSRRRISRRRK
jgi:hypothetical protein